MYRIHCTCRFAAAAPLGLLLMAASCEEAAETADACARPGVRTLVFYDQSASSVADPATDSLFRATLAALSDSALSCPGDAIRGFLVHGRTRGKIGRVEAANTIAPADTLGGSKMHIAKERNRHAREMAALREDAAERLLGLTSASVPAEFRRHTDMLGTLEVISDEMGQHPGSATRIYYFGDMHESMPAGRRDFDARPPRTRAEAETWADADTAFLRQMQVTPERFGDAEVRVYLGSLAARPHAEEVRAYWERLLRNAGFRSKKIHYN